MLRKVDTSHLDQGFYIKQDSTAHARGEGAGSVNAAVSVSMLKSLGQTRRF
jgi:hypothetical protein